MTAGANPSPNPIAQALESLSHIQKAAQSQEKIAPVKAREMVDHLFRQLREAGIDIQGQRVAGKMQKISVELRADDFTLTDTAEGSSFNLHLADKLKAFIESIQKIAGSTLFGLPADASTLLASYLPLKDILKRGERVPAVTGEWRDADLFYKILKSRKSLSPEETPTFLEAVSRGLIREPVSLESFSLTQPLGQDLFETLCSLCPHLTSFTGIFITDISVAILVRHCKKLTSLSFYQSPLTDAGLMEASINYPKLTHLMLDHCAAIGDEGLGAVSEHCKQLTHVGLRRIPITPEGFVYFIERALQLHFLKVQGLPDVTPALSSLVHCENLTHLDVSCPPEDVFTDEIIIPIVAACTKLLYLNLENIQITARTLIALTDYSKTLSHLGLADNTTLTNQAVASLEIPTLSYLGIKDCIKVTEEGIRAVVQTCRGLRHLEVSPSVYSKLQAEMRAKKPDLLFEPCEFDEAFSEASWNWET